MKKQVSKTYERLDLQYLSDEINKWWHQVQEQLDKRLVPASKREYHKGLAAAYEEVQFEIAKINSHNQQLVHYTDLMEDF